MTVEIDKNNTIGPAAVSSASRKKRILSDNPLLTDAEREAVLKWEARNWTPPIPEDEIDFWEGDQVTPDDPILAAEQDAYNDALLRVMDLEDETST